MTPLPDRDVVASPALQAAAARRAIVVLAGAGISAPPPASLPGWKPLNAAVIAALRQRLEAALSRPGWLGPACDAIQAERDADRFPPEYQAQLLEEMCGERYFQLLQALDTDTPNAAHERLADLAAAGALRAIVTTNFDRLAELALARRGVPFEVAFDDAGFVALRERLAAGTPGPLPIVKIHGCVSAHRSMIDTLKQRRRGRTRHLRECLDELQTGHWLYLGFSAADLDGDPAYLGLVAGAAKSLGATYVAHPPAAPLRPGARHLLDAFGTRGEVIVADAAEFLGGAGAVTAARPAPPFAERLALRVAALTPAAAGLCLAALAEAVGQADTAAHILDRLVRKELDDARGSADYRLLQLHHGRLGAAWGRFTAVPDLNGMPSNASVESLQSLLRIADSEPGFAARAWLACGYLWMNRGEPATQLAVQTLQGYTSSDWGGRPPGRDEEAVDAWLSAAQVLVVNAGAAGIEALWSTWRDARDRAVRCGDAVRTARVGALTLLMLAETTEDVVALAADLAPDFDEALRVGDRFASGLRALALGRWHVGSGAALLSRRQDRGAVAQRALSFLDEASAHLSSQSMDPWMLFGTIQRAKACADLHRFDDTQACIDLAARGVERFPVLEAHLCEAIAQVHAMLGQTQQAAERLEAARAAAESSGLRLAEQRLSRLAARVAGSAGE